MKVPLDQARKTPWPFSPYKGQLMGDLVNASKISLKDLGYAIETAWNSKIRQAAATLALSRLEQVVTEPQPSAGYAEAVSGGRSFAQKQETRLTLLQGLFFGIILATVIGVSILLFLQSHEGNAKNISDIISTPTGMFALFFVVLVGLFIGWLFNRLTDYITTNLDKKIEEYRLGQEGEDHVAQALLQILDGTWMIFRNVQIPGRSPADIDLILVGPPGVWALEVKNFRGKYRNIGDKWELIKKNKWTKAQVNPSNQALKNAVRLSQFLKANRIDVFVTGVVIWANPESPLTVENPSIAVWMFEQLQDEIGNVWQKEKLSEDGRKLIDEKLTDLCRRNRRR